MICHPRSLRFVVYVFLVIIQASLPDLSSSAVHFFTGSYLSLNG